MKILIKNIIEKNINMLKTNNYVRVKKPYWLKINHLNPTNSFLKIKKLKNKGKLTTVCEEAKCPNISECWSSGTSTLMLLGNVCTRSCKFCAVSTGNPNKILDYQEPLNVLNNIKIMGLKYVVLTSVDRDDLLDYGVIHYVNSINLLLKYCNIFLKVEALIPDFNCNTKCLDILVIKNTFVLAQNIETVESLTSYVRDLRAGYWKTLNVLFYIKLKNSKFFTKTSIMLGFGETFEDIISLLKDLKSINVNILTLGQYIQPTKSHISIKSFVTPNEFKRYQLIGLRMGFLEIIAGPLVRSSYKAEKSALLSIKNN